MDILKDKNSKVTFMGISLGGLSTTESAVAVIDRNFHIITLDKLFSMNDVKYFIDNYPAKQNAIILVSLAENEIMISSKWKYSSRTYHPVNLNSHMINRDDWTNRYSSRGCDYFKELKQNGTDIFRYDVDNIKMAFGNGYAFRERTPVDCKALQDTLRIKYNMRELPVNMLPVAQLEAILGAILAQMIVVGSNDFECRIIGEYETMPVLGV